MASKKEPFQLEKVTRGTIKFQPNYGAITDGSDSKSLMRLGHIPECGGSACELRGICVYRGKGRCTYIHNFYENMYETWVDPVYGIGDRLSQWQLNRIGTHLMPLYLHYIKFELSTYSNGMETTYEDNKGILHVYPQYEEIRRIMAAIDKETCRLKLNEIWAEKFPDKPSPVDVIPTAKEVLRDEKIRKKGNPMAYEAILSKD